MTLAEYLASLYPWGLLSLYLVLGAIAYGVERYRNGTPLRAWLRGGLAKAPRALALFTGAAGILVLVATVFGTFAWMWPSVDLRPPTVFDILSGLIVGGVLLIPMIFARGVWGTP